MILLIVDTQEMIVNRELYEYEKFVSNIKRLLCFARKNNVEVVYIRHDDSFKLTHGIEGFEIFKEFEPMPNEKIFDKHVNSAFKETGLDEYLRSKNETKVMVVGLQTDYCIDATIKCGFEHGLEMIVPAYCNTTVDNEYMTAEKSYRYYNEKMWNKRYSKGVSLDEALSLLSN